MIQGGSPGANEYIGDATFMRDEVGQWPHVRGAVGISTRGRDTGDAQIFIDLVDNPRLDHEYTVFAQVLNGMDVVDADSRGRRHREGRDPGRHGSPSRILRSSAATADRSIARRRAAMQCTLDGHMVAGT